MEEFPLSQQSLLSEDEFAHDSAYQDEVDHAAFAADGIVCASSFTRDSLVESGVKCPIYVVPYGVDTIRIKPKQAHDSRSPTIISFVGSVNERKGFSWLIEGIRTSGVDAILKIMTRRPVPAMYAEALSRIRHEIHVGLPDENVWNHVRGSHMFALPSIAEGFGLVILEAMACGVPVLATHSTGGRDVIRQGYDGWIVEPARSDQIAQAIAKASADFSHVATMGINARISAERHSWSAHREGLRLAYQQLCHQLL